MSGEDESVGEHLRHVGSQGSHLFLAGGRALGRAYNSMSVGTL